MQTTDKQQTSFLRELVEWAETLMLSMTIMIFLFTFFVGTVVVHGESMMKTLANRERLLIVQTYFRANFRDIVVIGKDGDMPLIKRVIATEGQTVDIDFESGIVFVDGLPLDEPYAAEPATLYRDDFIEFPVTVPKNCVFVMGDNRNNSRDSRVASIGMIATDDIFGKVLLRMAPLEKFGIIGLDTN